MKKFYTLIAIAIANFSNAQTVDFESVNLTANSVYDGSDLSGTPNSDTTAYDSTFVFSKLVMTNQWNSQYGYFSDGWAFSNKTDDTTTSLPGAYNSYAGGGVNGSDNYAVTYIGTGKVIQLENNAVATFGSISVTNNTYAAYSMLNGDNIAKKFGGTTGDDEDWFLLKIIGYDANGNSVDTIKFYLADYRFSDNAQDYIIKDWTSIDLTSFGEVNKIRFEQSSSDNGNFGMNTPSYLAIDNINFGFTSVNETNYNTLSVYPNPASATLSFSKVIASGNLSIYNLSGQKVIERKISSPLRSINISELSTGVYTLLLNQNGNISTTKLIKQ
jgi:hypothetical protein